MWEIQPKTLYTPAVVTEKSIKDKSAALQAFVTANIEATRIMKLLEKEKKRLLLPVDVLAAPTVDADGAQRAITYDVGDVPAGMAANARVVTSTTAAASSSVVASRPVRWR